MLEQLLAAIPRAAQPALNTAHGALKVGGRPDIFVPPPVIVREGDLADAELAFVEAPAAVGKTTLVRHISADRNTPVLDLAHVAAGAHTLAGSLVELSHDALQWLQAGTLTILVDALDEALIRSGTWNFDEFIRTCALLVQNSPRHQGVLKLVLFGRPPAVADALAGFEVFAEAVPRVHLQIDFFDEAGARKLVQQRANKPEAAVRAVLDAYFHAIEAALGGGPLWQSEIGRGFAGYAAVLDTLGVICAKEANLVNLINAFAPGAPGAQRAWEVLERVLDGVISRERDEKFLPALRGRGWSDPPEWVYDKYEQYLYITQLVRNVSYELSNRAHIAQERKETYKAQIEISAPGHPYIKEKRYANAVFAAVVAAYQICEVSARGSEIADLEDSARTPFLWRACRSFFTKSQGETLIDGELVGYVLASFWTDPLEQNPKVSIADTDRGGAEIIAADVRFLATFPLQFVQLIGESAKIRVSGDVILAAFTGSGSFELKRGVTLICRGLEIKENLLRLSGSEVTLSADSVVQPPNLNITSAKQRREGSAGQEAGEPFKLSIAGALAGKYPWSTVATETAAPNGEIADKWVGLIERCAQKASAQGLPALTQDGQPTQDEGAANWIRLQYPLEFPRLVTEIVSAGLGSLQVMQASGRPKYRLRVDFAWEDLLSAARRPAEAPDQLRTLVRKLRER